MASRSCSVIVTLGTALGLGAGLLDVAHPAKRSAATQTVLRNHPLFRITHHPQLVRADSTRSPTGCLERFIRPVPSDLRIAKGSAVSQKKHERVRIAKCGEELKADG
jgi:hypothetical protein